MMPDYIFYGTDIEVRYAFRMVFLSEVLELACNKHQLIDISHKRLLSESLLSGILLATLLQEEEKILLKIQKDNEFVTACETSRHGQVRGYLTLAHPQSPIDLSSSQPIRCYTSRGLLGKSAQFEGITELATPHLHEALTDHLNNSFQFNSRMYSSTWVDENTGKMMGFGAVFLELPNLDSNCSANLWTHVSSLPTMESIYKSFFGDPDGIASRLIPDKVHPVNSITPTWSCHCSPSHCVAIVSQLPTLEIRSMIDDGKPIDMRCHYCNTSYTLSLDELRQALALAQIKANQETGVN